MAHFHRFSKTGFLGDPLFIGRFSRYNTSVEYLDVLDDMGIPTGETKSRPAIHRDGDLHRAVHVWIVNDRNEVLIQKRSAVIDIFRGLWDVSLAGHVQSGEESGAAVRRELKEELDITVKDGDLQPVGTVALHLRDGEKFDNQLCDLFLLRRTIDPEQVKKQEQEVAKVALVLLNDLKKLVREEPERFVPRTEEFEKMFALLAP
jgi:isopentenyldiphosphate isomerase